MQPFAKVSVLLCALLLSASRAFAADDDLALAIVYDTSGSMAQAVRDRSGAETPKYVIANRALEAITARLEKYHASRGGKLQAGLFTFSGRGANVAVPLGAFDPAALRAWFGAFRDPRGGTPLGSAIVTAAQALLKAKAGSRHILVITDGENTVGRTPDAILPELQEKALKLGAPLYFHFVAFDVDAKVFGGVKKTGATLVSAADEVQLTERLGFILEEKILLEKE